MHKERKQQHSLPENVLTSFLFSQKMLENVRTQVSGFYLKLRSVSFITVIE